MRTGWRLAVFLMIFMGCTTTEANELELTAEPITVDGEVRLEFILCNRGSRASTIRANTLPWRSSSSASLLLVAVDPAGTPLSRRFPVADQAGTLRSSVRPGTCEAGIVDPTFRYEGIDETLEKHGEVTIFWRSRLETDDGVIEFFGGITFERTGTIP